MNYAEKFAKTLEAIFGKNFRHIELIESTLSGEGSPKAICWDSHGEIEVIKFSDGSTYEPYEVQFCKSNEK